ncbi:MAG: SDR family oxidoreductase [Candidatus Dormibacteria bacterium]
MRTLVIGASGLLGWHLYREFASRGSVAGTYRERRVDGLEPLDVTSLESVESVLDAHRPELILVPAAIPNVDRCELEPDQTRSVNVDGLRNVLEAARPLGARVVFFSTDYVFDGESPPYTEDSQVNPLNEYARQKLAGEELVIGSGLPHLVLRVTGLYGWERRGKNFVYRVLNTLRAGEVLTVPGDQVGTPTYVPDLCAAVARLVELNAGGVLHLAPTERLTRDAFARLIANTFGLDPDLVRAVPSSLAAQPARRPRDPWLDPARARELIGRGLVGATEGLVRMRASEPAEERV